jgi:uncharacterized membrane protein YagU involved in acid resistance
MKNRALAAVLIGGLVAGTLDLTYAIVFSAMHGYSATRVCQSVASGLLGQAAYDGGTSTALLGTVLHYTIAICAAAVYFVASRRIPLLTQRPVLSGAIFGVCMYLFMTFVLLPLSAYPRAFKFDLTVVVANLLAHMILFGQPIAWAASRVPRQTDGAAVATSGM